MAWIDFIPVALTAIAAVIDLRSREIPDSIWILILSLLPIRIWWFWPEITLWHHVAGGVIGLLIGCVVASNDRFGGGDVKLFAAICAWFGILAIFPLSLWCAIAGLPLAIVAALRGQADYAYGPALLIGVGVHWLIPNLLAQIGGWS